MTDQRYNVLFLCTGNSARSILAESILRHDGGDRFNAYSAGSDPKGEVNPLALQALESFGYPTAGLRSKNWLEFEADGAPRIDFIFTVCDNAAGEVCPIWPGHPMTSHWGIEDPSDAAGGDIARKAAFAQAFRYLKNRIAAFAALPLDQLEKSVLRESLKDIGRSDGASGGAQTAA